MTPAQTQSPPAELQRPPIENFLVTVLNQVSLMLMHSWHDCESRKTDSQNLVETEVFPYENKQHGNFPRFHCFHKICY